jgi:hypothetical protein
MHASSFEGHGWLTLHDCPVVLVVPVVLVAPVVPVLLVEGPLE